MKGIEEITKEREEQILKHGRTVSKDVLQNTDSQLTTAASRLLYADASKAGYPTNWDPDIWHKMRNKPYRERLVIAGALIAAEIDRRDYISCMETLPPDIREQIVDLFKVQSELVGDSFQVTEESLIANLRFDDLDEVELYMAIEQKLGYPLDCIIFESNRTVGEFIDAVIRFNSKTRENA